jgi:hypothetical protein
VLWIWEVVRTTLAAKIEAPQDGAPNGRSGIGGGPLRPTPEANSEVDAAKLSHDAKHSHSNSFRQRKSRVNAPVSVTKSGFCSAQVLILIESL